MSSFFGEGGSCSLNIFLTSVNERAGGGGSDITILSHGNLFYECKWGQGG